MVCSMKSMSNTRLPSEWAITARPTGSSPCTQWGCPPTTRSAPARTRARPTSDWTGSAECVYWSPQWGSTTTTSTRSASRPTTPVTWSRSARLSGPVRGGIRTERAPGERRVARGVSPIALKPTNPKRTPWRRPPRPGWPGEVAPGAEGLHPPPAERPERLVERHRPEVAGVVVGERQRVEAEPLEPRQGAGRSRERVTDGSCCGSPSSESVLSRLPTAMSARPIRPARKRSGCTGASGTATPRPSMMSPTTSSRVTGGGVGARRPPAAWSSAGLEGVGGRRCRCRHGRWVVRAARRRSRHHRHEHHTRDPPSSRHGHTVRSESGAAPLTSV